MSAKNSIALSRKVMLRIQRTRKAREFSAAGFAEAVTAAGYPLTGFTFRQWENRPRATVTIDFAVVAAEVLGMSLDELVSECEKCKGSPPQGFLCTSCGAVA